MRKASYIAAAAAAVASTSGAALAAPLTPGNLVVYRIGTGPGALTTNATAVFVDEYTSAPAQVAPVQSIAMPTVASGSNRALTAQGTAALEGFLNRSADGNYIILTGYDAATGTTQPAQTLSSNVNRVIGRIDALGNVDTSTAVTDLNNPGDGSPTTSGSPRSAISTNGTDMWIVGAEGGLRHTTFGTAGPSTLVSDTDGNNPGNATNLRHVDSFGGQLFVSSGSGALAAIQRVGTGTPTTSGQIMAGLLAGPGGGTTEPQQFFLADLDGSVDAFGGLDTLYVASDGALALTKYCWDAVNSNWLAVGTVGVNADNFRGLTGMVSGSDVTLFATKDIASDQLVSLFDNTGYTLTAGSFEEANLGSPILLATAAPGTAFKGVDLTVPEPGSAAILAVAGPGLLARRRRRN